MAQSAEHPIYRGGFARLTHARLPILKLRARDLADWARAELANPKLHAIGFSLCGFEHRNAALNVGGSELGERHPALVAHVEMAALDSIDDPFLEDGLGHLTIGPDRLTNTTAADRIVDRPHTAAEVNRTVRDLHGANPRNTRAIAVPSIHIPHLISSPLLPFANSQEN